MSRDLLNLLMARKGTGVIGTNRGRYNGSRNLCHMLLQSFDFQENKSKHTYVEMYVIDAFLYQCLFPE